MRRSASWLFLFLVASALSVAAFPLWAAPQDAGENHARDQAAIAQVLTQQQSAWNRGDVNAFLQGYWHSPELTFAGSNGFAQGWDSVMARYKKNYPNRDSMGQLDFSELTYRFLGPDAALVLGHWHLARNQGDVGGVFSLVWQRFPEGWRIIHDHTSAVNAVE